MLGWGGELLQQIKKKKNWSGLTPRAGQEAGQEAEMKRRGERVGND